MSIRTMKTIRFKYSKFYLIVSLVILIVIYRIYDTKSIEGKLQEKLNRKTNARSNNKFSSTSYDSSDIVISTVACGHKMFDQLVALLKSVALLSKRNIHLIILTDTLKDKITKEFNSWPESYRNRFKIEMIEPRFPNDEWKELYKPCASARLFLHELLPNVDSLIYLDADTVFLSPVEELWEYFSLMNSKQMIGIARESYHKDFGWFKDWGREAYKDIPYIRPVPFNSGILLLNLTRLRNNDWKTRINNYYNQYKDVLRATGDQGLVNIYLNKSTYSYIEIPCRWNYMDEHCMYSSESCKSAQILGIGLFHHHPGLSGRDISSYSVPQFFKNVSMTDHSIDHGIKYLIKDIQTKSKCKALYKNFIIGIERFKQKQ